MLIGYARVSTTEQNLDLQIDELQKVGCERIFHEKVSGVAPRFELMEAIKYARADDCLVVWKLDRLGRSMRDIIEISEKLAADKIGFMSVTDAIDTTSPGGKLYFHMMASFAQFERDVNHERTMKGIDAARSRGVNIGRPAALSDKQIKQVLKMVADDEPVPDIAETFNVSRDTIYRVIKKQKTIS